MPYCSHAGQIEVKISIGDDENLTMVELSLDDASLSECLGEEMAEEFLATLRPKQNTPTAAMRIPLDLSSADPSGAPLQSTEDLRQLQIQARVFEYLGLAANHLLARKVEEKDPQKYGVTRRALLARRVHEEIMRHDGKIPSLDVLARRYRVSVTTLNNGFREVFGKTIGVYVNEHRLNKARVALVETDIAMKTLAARLGYSHVNHFITAFKRQFGCSPGSLRGRRRPKMA